MCVKLCIITREVSRQIKNFFQRIETYSSSFRMFKEFECTSYFKPTSLHPQGAQALTCVSVVYFLVYLF